MGFKVKSVLSLGVVLAAAAAVWGQDPARQEENLRLKQSLQDLEVPAGWIYNDLQAAFDMARKDGKPLFVVFRCVP